MGEEADYLIDRILEAEFYFEYDDMLSYDELDRRLKADIWTTRDGKTVLLKEMTDRHLQNSIAHIQKHGSDSVYGYGNEWLPKLKKELKHRGRFGIRLPD